MRFTTIPRSSKPEVITAHSVEGWREFIDFLTDPANNRYCAKPSDLSADAKKEQAPGFIGAFLGPDAGGACREAVKTVQFLHVDIDFMEEIAEFVANPEKGKPGRIVKTKRRVDTTITRIEQVREVFQKAGILAAIYETLSSAPTALRARALVPLDREITPDDSPRAFTELMTFLEPLALAVDLGVGLRVGGHVYMPMGAPVLETLNCEPFSPELDGEPMGPREPLGIAEARKLLKKDRKKHGLSSDFDNADLEDWYQRFMIDFKTLDLRAALEEVGCKIGRPRVVSAGVMKYPCTCPLADEHSGGKSHRDEAVIFENAEGAWPSFQCQHSHKITLKELVLGTVDGGDPVLTQEILSRHAAAWTPTMPQAAIERAQKIRNIQQESVNGLGPWEPWQKIRRDDTLPDSVIRDNKKTGGVIIQFPATAANLWYIVQHDERFKNLWFCEMRGVTFLDDKPFGDEMIGRILIQLSADYQFSTKPDDTKLYRIICTSSLLNKRYLPTEYLESLPIPQRNDAEFERIVIEHLGVESYMAKDAALYLKNFAVGTVARSLTPRSEFDDTAKMDDMMIWISEQGAMKSTFIRSMVPASWMSAELHPPTGRYDSVSFVAMIQRGWINEFCEVDSAFKRFEEMKAFLSTRSDIVQLKYLNGSVAFPRRCSFIGTSNKDALLEDPTGNRRIFILRCAVSPGFVIKPLSPLQRDAMWSAAIAAWKAGDNWWLTKDEEKRKDLQDATINHKLGGNSLVHWIAKQLLKQAPDWSEPFTYMNLLEQIKGRFAGDPEVAIGDMNVGNALKFLGIVSERSVKWDGKKTVSGPVMKHVTFKTWEIARGLGIVTIDEGPATQSEFNAVVEKKV